MHFPKFSISGSYNLDQILPMLGIRDLFSRQANLSGIATERDLLVSRVSHQWPSTPRHFNGNFCPSGVAGCWVLSLPPREVSEAESVQSIIHRHGHPRTKHHVLRVALVLGIPCPPSPYLQRALPVTSRRQCLHRLWPPRETNATPETEEGHR